MANNRTNRVNPNSDEIEQNAIEPEIDGNEKSIETVLEDINNSVDEISGEKKNALRTNKVSRTAFDPQEKIPCKSLFLGKLTYKSPTTGALYVWGDYGVVTSLPFFEIEAMSNNKRSYLEKPLVLINNASVVDYLNLNEIYERVANISKLEELFNSGNLTLIRRKIKEAVEVNQRDTVLSQVRKMRKDNKLVDVNIIAILNEELKFDIG